MEKLNAWFENLGTNLLHLIDQRILVMTAILLLLGFFLIGPEQWALVKTTLQLCLGLFLGSIAALLIRKLILHNDFDLQEVANKADQSTGCAIVYASTLAFQFGVIVLVVIKILP